MIADRIENASAYYCLGERFKKAFEYLKNTDFSKLAPDKYQVLGDEVFVLLQDYESKDTKDGKWESHKLYADIQYVLKGNECMGYAPVEVLTLVEDQRPSKDALIFKDETNRGSLVRIEEGMFAVFFPQDGHMPNIACDGISKNRKAVAKVLL